MATPTDPTDQIHGNDVATADVDARTTSGSGCVLPLIHTSIDARLEDAYGGHRLLITIDGTEVETPPVEDFVFYGGLAALVGAGLMELPIALALGVGHALIDLTHRPALRAIGEVLEEA
jgi:hypothetical protein